LGLKPSDAINALFAQIASRKALPFSLATSDSSYAREGSLVFDFYGNHDEVRAFLRNQQ
jgi:antitoxin component of RelBE/YafQ-DinJ toxin-antitoxin module